MYENAITVNNSRPFRAFRSPRVLCLRRCVCMCVCTYVCVKVRGLDSVSIISRRAAPADYLPAHAGALCAGKLLPVWPENYVPAELAASLYADSPAR